MPTPKEGGKRRSPPQAPTVQMCRRTARPEQPSRRALLLGAPKAGLLFWSGLHSCQRHREAITGPRFFERVVAYGYGYGYGLPSMRTIAIQLTEAQALAVMPILNLALHDLCVTNAKAGEVKDVDTQNRTARDFKAVKSVAEQIDSKGKATFFGW